MKKKYLVLALAAALMTTSCDLDVKPVGYLDTDTALQNPSNFQAARQTLYAYLKSSIGGMFYNAPDIQSDCFNAVAGFSNTYGEMYRWDFTTNTDNFSTAYGNFQALIKQANFIIDGYKKADPENNPELFPDGSSVSATAGLKIARSALGDAYFMRAYAIFGLIQYFSPAYTAENANTPDLGASYNLNFNMSFDASTYPGRKTLAESYQQVYDDLDKAGEYVTTAGSARSEYVTVDAIHALRARVALNQKDYTLAAKEADIVINNTTAGYSLCSSTTQLENEWWMDGYGFNGGSYSGTNETIFRLVTSSTSDLPGQTGYNYLPKSTGATPDYIPTKDVLALYSADDMRLPVFFTSVDVTTTTGSTGRVKCLNKYNKAGVIYQYMTSQDETAEFAHEPKVFRLPEMYLISAEAYALQETPNMTRASKRLNDLRKKRIANLRTSTYTNPEDLMAELRKERLREFIGDGMRLFDLKRWGLGVKRGIPQQRDLCSTPGSNTTDLDVPAGNYRMTWPIPKDETEVNKQVKQNTGY